MREIDLNVPQFNEKHSKTFKYSVSISNPNPLLHTNLSLYNPAMKYVIYQLINLLQGSFIIYSPL